MGKDPFASRDVQSRRGGPVKPPLSREAIVGEALQQLLRDGLAELSLRKVAAALDTGPASLYAYVAGLPALEALVLDRALGDVDLTGGGKRRGWRERLKQILASQMQVLQQSRGLAHLGSKGLGVGPNALRILDTLLGLLAEGGFPVRAAAWTADLLLLHANAIAAEQSNGHDPQNPEGPIVRALASATAASYPHVAAARAELLAGEASERFAWAIDAILGGVEQVGRVGGKRPSRRAKR